MKRKIILVVILVIVGAVGGSYLYQEWSERQRIQFAVDYADKLRQQAQQEPDKLVGEAKALMDDWTGSGDGLNRAGVYIQQVQIAHPNHVRARIEKARWILNKGHINYRHFTPGTLDQAEAQLQEALKIAPDVADVHVLLAHVQTLKGLPKLALQTLEKAEQLGTPNPWLYLNWVRALLDVNRPNDAEARLAQARERVLSLNPPPKNLVSNLYEYSASVYSAQRKFEEADKAYQELIAFRPDFAWGYGNYSNLLLYGRGMPDAAIAMAENALKIMDYGMGRQILASALYAKWAEVKQQSPQQAEQYLARGKALGPDFGLMMTLTGSSISRSPVLLTMFKELMGLGVPVDIRNDNGDTALNIAAYHGENETVELLIELGADVESRDKLGRTALASASLKERVDTVRLLAANKADVNAQDQYKITPLHWAVESGNADLVKVLLGLKAEINHVAVDLTPLMRAALRGNEVIVRILLEAGADTAVKTGEKQHTAADIAREGGFSDVAELIREVEAQRSRRKR